MKRMSFFISLVLITGVSSLHSQEVPSTNLGIVMRDSSRNFNFNTETIYSFYADTSTANNDIRKFNFYIVFPNRGAVMKLNFERILTEPEGIPLFSLETLGQFNRLPNTAREIGFFRITSSFNFEDLVIGDATVAFFNNDLKGVFSLYVLLIQNN